jgi:hypothetical protein
MIKIMEITMPPQHENVIAKRLDFFLEKEDRDSLPSGEEKIFIGYPPAQGGILYEEETLHLGIPPFSQLLPASSCTKVFNTTSIGNVHGKLPIHELNVDDLRRFPRYLCDAILKPNRILIPGDHYLFWAWTGAFFRYLTGKHPGGHWHFHSAGPPPGINGVPRQSMESRPGRYGPHIWGEKYKTVLEDFFTLLHMLLLPIREISRPTESRAKIYSLNPSYLGIQKDLGYKFATGSGFSILEGILRRRCKEINENGIVKSGHGPLNLSHKSHPIGEGGRVYLFDALMLWKEQNAGPLVEQTLDEIDDVSRYNINSLVMKFGGLDYNDLTHRDLNSPSLLKGIKEQRNYNIHGEDSTMAIGAIVVTLCCLVLWDELNESDIQYDLDRVHDPSSWPDPATYSGERDRAMKLIREHQAMLDNGYWSVPTDAAGLPLDRLTPRTFYPVRISVDQFGFDIEW